MGMWILRKTEVSEKTKSFNKDFQEIIAWAEIEQGRDWNEEREKAVFVDQRCRMAGDHNGLTRQATFDVVTDPEASPGQIMLPAVKVNFNELSNRTFVRVLG